MKEYKLLINGKWEDGAEKRDIKSPYNGKKGILSASTPEMTGTLRE